MPLSLRGGLSDDLRKIQSAATTSGDRYLSYNNNEIFRIYRFPILGHLKVQMGGV